MFTKAFLLTLLIGLAGIVSLLLIFSSFVKGKKKRFLSRKWSFTLGTVLLIIILFTGINLAYKVYTKIKTTITALQNFPETVGTETVRDTTDYIRILKSYEPEKYKGKVPMEFYTNYGFSDRWRFPLVYPYSISCTDVFDKGVIANDSGKKIFEEGGMLNTVTPYFDRFIFDKNYLAGMIVQDTGKTKNRAEYFILNFLNSKQDTINDRTSMLKKLDEINFKGGRDYITVREYSERF